MNQKFDEFQNRVTAKIETLHHDYQALTQRFEHFASQESLKDPPAESVPEPMQFTLGQQEVPLVAENADAMIASIRKNLEGSKEALTYSLRVSRRY